MANNVIGKRFHGFVVASFNLLLSKLTAVIEITVDRTKMAIRTTIIILIPIDFVFVFI